MSKTLNNGGEGKRIAVIAIHGVGDHEQFATAREIGDLLCNLEYKPSRTPRYAPFTESMNRIHVRPVHVGVESTNFNWADKALQKNTWGPMHALANAVFRNSLRTSAQSSGPDNSADTLDHLFMKGQLVAYKGERPEDTYQCLRLEGKRVSPIVEPGTPPARPTPDTAGEMGARLREGGVDLPKGDSASPGTQEKLVHIYEMYWADLSRLSNAFTQVFGELYQMLFHLGAVSVNNVLAAAIHLHGKKGGKQWRLFSQAQWFTAAILAWPIPILTLFMAAFTPAVFLLGIMRAQHFSEETEFLALDVLAALLLITGSAYLLGRVPRLNPLFYPLPLLLFGGLASVAIPWGVHWRQDHTEEALAAVIVALSLGAVWLILRAYAARRPGSLLAAACTGGILLLTVLLMAAAAGSFPAGPPLPYPAIAMCLNGIEAAFGLLTLSWIVFYASYAWAHFAGGYAVRAVKCKTPNPEYVKARRARWTAQLVLALSSVVFVVMTLSVWTGIIDMARRLLPPAGQAVVKYEPSGACLYDFLWRHCPPVIQHQIGIVTFGAAQKLEELSRKYVETPPNVSDWADQMLSIAGIGLLPVFLAAMFVAGLCAAWALFPSIVDELSPPKSGPPDDTEDKRRQAARKLQEESVSRGIWLNRGFKFMHSGGWLLYWTMWLPPFLFVFLNLGFVFWVHANEAWIKPFTNVVGTLVAGTAIGIFGLAGRFKTLARSFRPLVRVMLDVDNWLREHPRDSNPTARICGRYVSLLRYVSAWRDPSDGKPYDALVIVAHSQGTVITADFLRFLKTEKDKAGSMSRYDPELERFDRLPVYFFTMGCPLHQLYGLRFPHLYGWARDDAPARRSGTIPDIGPNDAPGPEELGVMRWINAYRSGDYVGRYLWRGGEASYDWQPALTSYDGDWDPPAGKPEKISADPAGKRIECCIGPGAHTHYWDHTAALIAEVLDRLINNAGFEPSAEVPPGNSP